MINEANKKADVILRTAKNNCDKVLAEFRAKIIVEKENAVKLLDAVSNYKTSLYTSYNQHLSLIDEICTEISGLEEIVVPEDELVKATLEKIKGNISQESEKLLAEKTAVQIKNDANKEAERIIVLAKSEAENNAKKIMEEKLQEANAAADKIIADANFEAEKLSAEIQQKLSSLKDEIFALENKKEQLENECKSISESEINGEDTLNDVNDFNTSNEVLNNNAINEHNADTNIEEAIIPNDSNNIDVQSNVQDEIDSLIKETFYDNREIPQDDSQNNIEFEEDNSQSNESVKEEIKKLNQSLFNKKEKSQKLDIDSSKETDIINSLIYNE